MKLTGIDELSRKFDIEAESKVAFEMAKGNGKNAKKMVLFTSHFSLSRNDVMVVRADVIRGKVVSGNLPHRFWAKAELAWRAAIP